MPTDDRREGLDLVLTRTVDLPRALLWKAWTIPEHIKQWFAPKPWITTECEIDLRPGGLFRTVMRSPEGKDYPNVGCILEVVENQRLVWTDALGPGYRPAVEPFFTAIITFEDHGKGTRYIARALHKNDADIQKHEEMGFFQGWGQVAEQLFELARQMK